MGKFIEFKEIQTIQDNYVMKQIASSSVSIRLDKIIAYRPHSITGDYPVVIRGTQIQYEAGTQQLHTTAFVEEDYDAVKLAIEEAFANG